MALQLEAEYYVLKSNRNKLYDIAWAYLKTNEEQIEKEKIKLCYEDFRADVDSTINVFDGLDEDKLKILFKKIADLMIERPVFYPYILSLALKSQ